MPAGDGTGPVGAGRMTGRAAGYCAGYGVPGYANPGPGFGMGRGRGRGFGLGTRFGWGRGRGPGWGRGYGRGYARVPFYGAPYGYGTPYAPPAWGDPPAREDELDDLKAEASHLEGVLGDIQKRIQELESTESDE